MITGARPSDAQLAPRRGREEDEEEEEEGESRAAGERGGGAHRKELNGEQTERWLRAQRVNPRPASAASPVARGAFLRKLTGFPSSNGNASVRELLLRSHLRFAATSDLQVLLVQMCTVNMSSCV